MPKDANLEAKLTLDTAAADAQLARFIKMAEGRKVGLVADIRAQDLGKLSDAYPSTTKIAMQTGQNVAASKIGDVSYRKRALQAQKRLADEADAAVARAKQLSVDESFYGKALAEQATAARLAHEEIRRRVIQGKAVTLKKGAWIDPKTGEPIRGDRRYSAQRWIGKTAAEVASAKGFVRTSEYERAVKSETAAMASRVAQQSLGAEAARSQRTAAQQVSVEKDRAWAAREASQAASKKQQTEAMWAEQGKQAAAQARYAGKVPGRTLSETDAYERSKAAEDATRAKQDARVRRDFYRKEAERKASVERAWQQQEATRSGSFFGAQGVSGRLYAAARPDMPKGLGAQAMRAAMGVDRGEIFHRWGEAFRKALTGMSSSKRRFFAGLAILMRGAAAAWPVFASAGRAAFHGLQRVAVFSFAVLRRAVTSISSALLSVGSALGRTLMSLPGRFMSALTAPFRMIGSIFGMITKVRHAFWNLAFMGGMIAGGVYTAVKAMRPAGRVEVWRKQFAMLFGEGKTPREKYAAGIGPGGRELSWLQKIAPKLPFDVEQVVEAGKMMRTFRLYARSAFLTAADAAHVYGKSLEQVITAMGFVSQGRVLRRQLGPLRITPERLQEFGVQFKGGRMVDDPMKAVKAMLAIWRKDVGGMGPLLANSFEVALVNMDDAWFNFRARALASLVPFGTQLLHSLTGGLDTFAGRAEKRDWSRVGSAIAAAVDMSLNTVFGEGLLARAKRFMQEFAGRKVNPKEGMGSAAGGMALEFAATTWAMLQMVGAAFAESAPRMWDQAVEKLTSVFQKGAEWFMDVWRWGVDAFRSVFDGIIDQIRLVIADLLPKEWGGDAIRARLETGVGERWNRGLRGNATWEKTVKDARFEEMKALEDKGWTISPGTREAIVHGTEDDYVRETFGGWPKTEGQEEAARKEYRRIMSRARTRAVRNIRAMEAEQGKTPFSNQVYGAVNVPVPTFGTDEKAPGLEKFGGTAGAAVGAWGAEMAGRFENEKRAFAYWQNVSQMRAIIGQDPEVGQQMLRMLKGGIQGGKPADELLGGLVSRYHEKGFVHRKGFTPGSGPAVTAEQLHGKLAGWEEDYRWANENLPKNTPAFREGRFEPKPEPGEQTAAADRLAQLSAQNHQALMTLLSQVAQLLRGMALSSEATAAAVAGQ